MIMAPNPKFGNNTESASDSYANDWSSSESSEDEDMIAFNQLYCMVGCLDSASGVEKNASARKTSNNMKVSSESETEDEVSCPVENHEGREMIDMLLPFSVDYVFTMIFTDSQWFQDFLILRKSTDFIPSDWQLCPETGDKLRQLSYTVALNLAIAKSAQSTESQRMLKISVPGESYIIETDVSNHGVPYSDSFSIKSHNCITRISKQQCRFRVYSQITYKKSVWGIVKTVIEKNAMQGAVDFCTDLEKALKTEADKVNKGQIQREEIERPKRLVESQKKLISQQTPSDVIQKRPTASFIPVAEETSLPKQSLDLIIKAILTMLVLLLLLNMMLILKLGSLEDLSLKLNTFPDDSSTTPLESIPNLSKVEFLRILRKQEILHRTEISKWQEALNDILKLFHLMENSLIDLKSTIDSYSNSATIKSMLEESAQAKS